MSDLRAEDFYNDIKEFVDKPQFTKLTSTGISSDYKSVFEFAEAYFDARMEANGLSTGEKQCNLPVVSGSYLTATINSETIKSGKKYKCVLGDTKDVIVINDKGRKEHFSRQWFE